MTWGSKAAANPQVRARADVNSQENWACWAEKLQTQKTPLQTAIPTPGPQVIPSQPHRVGLLGGPGGVPGAGREASVTWMCTGAGWWPGSHLRQAWAGGWGFQGGGWRPGLGEQPSHSCVEAGGLMEEPGRRPAQGSRIGLFSLLHLSQLPPAEARVLWLLKLGRAEVTRLWTPGQIFHFTEA